MIFVINIIDDTYTSAFSMSFCLPTNLPNATCIMEP